MGALFSSCCGMVRHSTARPAASEPLNLIGFEPSHTSIYSILPFLLMQNATGSSFGCCDLLGALVAFVLLFLIFLELLPQPMDCFRSKQTAEMTVIIYQRRWQASRRLPVWNQGAGLDPVSGRRASLQKRTGAGTSRSNTFASTRSSAFLPSALPSGARELFARRRLLEWTASSWPLGFCFDSCYLLRGWCILPVDNQPGTGHLHPRAKI